MNTRAARMRLFSVRLNRRISQPSHSRVHGPMMYMNRSV